MLSFASGTTNLEKLLNAYMSVVRLNENMKGHYLLLSQERTAKLAVSVFIKKYNSREKEVNASEVQK